MKQLIKTTKKWNVYVDEKGVKRFENKNWVITCGEYGYGRVLISGDTHGELVTIYSPKRLGFEFPERVPQYVKEACYQVVKSVYDAGLLER